MPCEKITDISEKEKKKKKVKISHLCFCGWKFCVIIYHARVYTAWQSQGVRFTDNLPPMFSQLVRLPRRRSKKYLTQHLVFCQGDNHAATALTTLGLGKVIFISYLGSSLLFYRIPIFHYYLHPTERLTISFSPNISASCHHQRRIEIRFKGISMHGKRWQKTRLSKTPQKMSYFFYDR